VKFSFKEIFPVVFITVVVLVSVGLLAFTDSITHDMRESQREQKILDMLNEMYPEMSRYTFENDVYTVFADETIAGYAYLAQGKGYGGYIDILVGLEDETTLRGISIIKHSESPGLGARITEDEYRGQYIGLDVDEAELEYDGGQIDAITGATISSKAVADAVRTTAIEKIKEIFEGTGNNDG
jgi:electron transport complex protein RnfG